MPITNLTHQLYPLYFWMAQELQIGLQFTTEILLFQTHSIYMFHNNYMALKKMHFIFCIAIVTIRWQLPFKRMHILEIRMNNDEKMKGFFLQWATCHVTNTTIKTREIQWIFWKKGFYHKFKFSSFECNFGLNGDSLSIVCVFFFTSGWLVGWLWQGIFSCSIMTYGDGNCERKLKSMYCNFVNQETKTKQTETNSQNQTDDLLLL